MSFVRPPTITNAHARKCGNIGLDDGDHTPGELLRIIEISKAAIPKEAPDCRSFPTSSAAAAHTTPRRT